MTTENDPDVKLDALSHGGDAVARRQPVTFVPYGAPGDVVRLHRVETRKNFQRAWIQSVVSPSPDRTEAPCRHHFKPGDEPSRVCGGCDWQHLKYASQAAAKRQLVVEAFQRIGRIAKPNVEPTVTAEGENERTSDGEKSLTPSVSPSLQPAGAWRYRNKVQVPIGQDAAGRLIGGFYAPGSHTIVPFEDCIVQPAESVKILKTTLDWFQRNPPPPGWLRHVLIRMSSGGEALVTVISNGEKWHDAHPFSKNLIALCPSVQGVFQNINTRADNVIVGPEWRHIFGAPFMTENVLGLKFRLSPGSFFQVHHAMAEKLYKLAEEMAAPGPDSSILELYAGVGAMAQLLARKARYVWGVEENPAAVQDAVESAKWNGLRNVRFLVGRCETALARGRFQKGPEDRLGAVVLDPPRAGCAEHVLRGVMRLRPERIVYVSCDPATLARDARYLSTGGYHLQRCAPVDLFPQTSHIESVSLFVRSPKLPPAPVPPPAEAASPAPAPVFERPREHRPKWRPSKRPDRPFRPKKPFRPGGERPGQPDRPFRPNKPFRPGQRPGGPPRPDRPFHPGQRPGGPSRPGQPPDRPPRRDQRPDRPFRPKQRPGRRPWKGPRPPFQKGT
jgi:23S rRNA (uracil1939-C5)-methyltransferase